MSKVLVTGGAGFIGGRLVKHLLMEGDTVVVLDDLSTGSESNLAGMSVDFRRGSILDEEQLCAAAEGVDRIVHLAAIPSVPRSIADPVRTHHANATGTLSVMEAARQFDVQHVIVASSSSVYGSNTELPKHELAWVGPKSPYAVSKLATESYATAFRHAYGLNTLAFRFFNVYGPGQSADHAYAAVIPRFISAALRGQPLQIEGDGLQTRDFTYVDTVCEALVRAGRDSLADDHPVNLAFGARVSLLDLVDLLEEVLGTTLERRFLSPRTGDVRDSQADSTRLHDIVGHCTPVPLMDGLRQTVTWFRESGRW